MCCKEEFHHVMDVLKKNENALGVKVFERKYQKAYESLLAEAKKQSEDYFKNSFIQGIYVRKDFIPEYLDAANTVSRNYQEEYSKAFNDRDIQEMERTAEQAKIAFQEKLEKMLLDRKDSDAVISDFEYKAYQGEDSDV